MNITCTECHKTFSQEQTLNFSWVNPTKHFGCPHCRTFFKRNPFHVLIGAGIPLLFTIFGLQFLLTNVGDNLPARHLVGVVLLVIGISSTLINKFMLHKNIQNLQKVSGNSDSS